MTQPLVTEAESNVMAITVDNLYSPPDSWNPAHQQYTYSITTPIPYAGVGATADEVVSILLHANYSPIKSYNKFIGQRLSDKIYRSFELFQAIFRPKSCHMFFFHAFCFWFPFDLTKLRGRLLVKNGREVSKTNMEFHEKTSVQGT